MELKTTTQKVLEEASKSTQAEETLKRLFPECFDSKKIIFTTSDGVGVYHGDSYFAVYQKDAFVREEVVSHDTCYASDWSHLRFSNKENAIKYAHANNKIKFSLLEIEHACFHSNIKKEDVKKLLDFFDKKLK